MVDPFKIEKNKIDVDNSWMIGDRDSDISAGLKAGLKTIFINQHWHSETGASSDKVCNSLSEAVDFIITYAKQ
jgi:D-glycero-D-manno-heptose 1,7-bisphosphate phosphatase